MSQGESISWKRISVEAAAVVASILLAFAIDAGWDARNERAEEVRALGALRSELQENHDLIGSAIQAHESFRSDASRLLDISRGRVAPPESNLELLLPIVNSLFRDRTTNLGTGSSSTLLASGQIGLIRDAEIRDRIAALPSEVEEALEDETHIRTFMTQSFTPYVVEQLPEVPTLDFDELFPGTLQMDEQSARALNSQIRAVLGSPEFEALLGLRLNLQNVVIRSLQQLQVAYVELIEMINRSLGTG